MQRLFSFKDADISIAGKVILKNVSFEILENQHIVLAGSNGSGKTTLCKAVAGKLFIPKGSARTENMGYDEIKMVSFTDDGKLFHSVNNVHYYQQRFNAWDADGFITVREYLISKNVHLSNKEHLNFIRSFGLSDLLETERIKLSSGQTRKLLLTSAVLSNPKLLVLDNPYIGLDAKSRDFLNNFLDELTAQKDITLLLSGQFSTLPKCITRYLYINHQSIFEEAKQSVHSKVEPKMQELEQIRDFYANLISGDQNPTGTEFIKFSDVQVNYGNKSILKDFNWTVKGGERWALHGNNGSGKSTIVSMIYADHPQIYSQPIWMFEQRFGKGRSIWEVKKEVGFTSPELHAYFRTNLSAEEIVWTGLFDKFEIMGPVDDEIAKFSSSLFRYFNLEQQQKKPYTTLPTGQQRICLLIRALIKAPKIILLDEPFQGMDPENIRLSRALIDHIIQPHQALIFISHFNEELPRCIEKKLSLAS